MNKKIAIYYLKRFPEVLNYALAIDSAINRGWISDGLRLEKFDSMPEHLKNASFTVYRENLFREAY